MLYLKKIFFKELLINHKLCNFVGKTGKDQIEPFPLSVPSYLSFESENKT